MAPPAHRPETNAAALRVRILTAQRDEIHKCLEDERVTAQDLSARRRASKKAGDKSAVKKLAARLAASEKVIRLLDNELIPTKEAAIAQATAALQEGVSSPSTRAERP